MLRRLALAAAAAVLVLAGPMLAPAQIRVMAGGISDTERAFAERLLAVQIAFHRRLAPGMPERFEVPTSIFDSRPEFNAFARASRGTRDVAGYSSTRLREVVLLRRRGRFLHLNVHELQHAALLIYPKHSHAPFWIDEGLAQYYERVWLDPKRDRF